MKRFRVTLNHQKRTYTIREYNAKGYLIVKYRSYEQQWVEEFSSDKAVEWLLKHDGAWIIKRYKNSKQRIK